MLNKNDRPRNQRVWKQSEIQKAAKDVIKQYHAQSK